MAISANKQGATGTVGGGISVDPVMLQQILDGITNFVEKYGQVLVQYLETPLSTEGYNIGSRVFWISISTKLMKEYPNLFIPGIPDRFQVNYIHCMEFVNNLEIKLCYSESAWIQLRSEPNFTEFIHKWQLNAYFSIRQKTVIQSIETVFSSLPNGGSTPSVTQPQYATSLATGGGGSSALSRRNIARSNRTSTRPFETKSPGDGFITLEATVIYRAMAWCWNDNVFIGSMAHKFWRLFLQLVLRYNQYLQDHPIVNTSNSHNPNQGLDIASPPMLPTTTGGGVPPNAKVQPFSPEFVQQSVIRLHDVINLVDKSRDLLETKAKDTLAKLYWNPPNNIDDDNNEVFDREGEVVM